MSIGETSGVWDAKSIFEDAGIVDVELPENNQYDSSDVGSAPPGGESPRHRKNLSTGVSKVY